jgi:hypothetical protein
MPGNRPDWVMSCEGADPASSDKCAWHKARAGGYVSGPQFAAVTRREPVGWNSRGATIRLARTRLGVAGIRLALCCNLLRQR